MSARVASIAVAAAFVAVGCFLAAAPRPSLVRVEASRMSMACLYTIEAYGEDRGALAQTLEDALDEVDRIDRLMSHYKPESPLSRINREADGQAIEVDAELFGLIAESLRYAAESDGAFDITVGPLMKAWGFFRGEGRVPTARELAGARALVGPRRVRLDARRRTIQFDRSGVELDLGGIAKGYAVDRVVALLERRGVTAALVSAGGSSIYALGAPPGLAAWAIDIQDPIDDDAVAFKVGLSNRALSIAGRSEKSFDVSGVRYDHILDPRTGTPVRGILTVIVQSDTATAGDALDTALFVLGVERSRTLVRKHPRAQVTFLVPDRRASWRRLDQPNR